MLVIQEFAKMMRDKFVPKMYRVLQEGNQVGYHTTYRQKESVPHYASLQAVLQFQHLCDML